jgi:hypothetical protein
MNPEEFSEQKTLVYRAAIQFIQIKGLDEFIEYLQQVEDTGVLPSTCALDLDTYTAILRQAIADSRKEMFGR